MRISVDRDRCVGSGLCVMTEPAVFDQDEADATVKLITDRPDPALADSVREAISLCPARALSLTGE